MDPAVVGDLRNLENYKSRDDIWSVDRFKCI